MKKSVLLIGLGKFGLLMLDELNTLGHEVMAVDELRERVDSILPYVTDAQIGDTTNPLFLESLGVDNFDLCFVTIGDNFQNSLETTSLLKELGAKKVISRAESDVQEKFLLRNGADEVIYPQKESASRAVIRHTAEHILDYMELEDGYALFEVDIPEEWYGKTLRELDVRNKHNINIVAVKNDGKLQPTIQADLVFDGNDSLLVLGEMKQIRKCFRL